MSKFRINEELFETALYESDGALKKEQKGTIIVFPEIPQSDIYLMEEFIKEVFGKVEAQLGREYNEAGDPTIFWETGVNGRHFCGNALNHLTKETFGPNSPTIYIAGCSDTTADYLVEVAIDAMYNASSKHDRKVDKKGGEKIYFNRYKTFLVYHVGSSRFYQFGSHENQLYLDRTVPTQEVVVYPMPHS